MKKHIDTYPTNPNTRMFWDYYYGEKKIERKNNWLFPSVLDEMNELRDRIIRRGGETLRFLEIGCGAGRTIHELRKLFNQGSMRIIQWAGMDYSQVGIKKAKAKYGLGGITFFVEDIEGDEIKRQRDGYDFILCSETMEHITNPEMACYNMKNLLNKNGAIFITVPVEGSILDKNPLNLHYITYCPEDFKFLFEGMNVKTWEIDKHHLAVEITN